MVQTEKEVSGRKLEEGRKEENVKEEEENVKEEEENVKEEEK